LTDGSGLIGRRIGVYEVLSLLGAGGMGEVYRARDARLERDVALKVLRPSLAADPELMARLEREARVLATLSHPHIGAIYQIEDIPAPAGGGTGARALVLELVGGETLADHLARAFAAARTGLPVAEVLEIAAQIVSALDSAHERGIVHRDLKPVNIKLTGDRLVKVLDFGLAKAAASAESSHSPTLSSESRDGVLLGTPAYMSPEQVRGRAIDKRTDIWAFGCVLYELLAGRPVFARATIADTIAAVLNDEPDWDALPASTPVHVRRLLESCLTKDPRRRLRDIGDARLDAPDADVETARAPALQAADVRFQRLTDLPGMNEAPAISPDGRMVAFVAMAGGRRHLFTLLLSGGTPLQITRGDGHHDHPRWAPDSSAILYYAPPDGSDEEGSLWEIPALGGTPRPIAAALGGGDISRSGRRIAFFRLRNDTQELLTSDRDGMHPRVVATMASNHPCKSVRWSPDERWIAFQSTTVTQFSEELTVVPAEGGAPRTLASAGSMNGLSWMPDGTSIVYSSSAGSTLPYPRTCNLRAIGVDGSGDRQLTFGDASQIGPDVHASGTLVASRIRTASDIWKFPIAGAPIDNVGSGVRLTRQTGQVQTPSVSPDGLEVVFLSDTGAHGNLWVSRADGSSIRQLTFERDRAVTIGAPLWSPAGNRIAFVRGQRSGTEIRVINANGRGLRLLVPDGFGAAWSRDGRWLYYTRSHGARWCIEKIPVDGGEAVRVRGDAYLHSPAVGDGVLYFAVRSNEGSSVGWTICRASPEDGPAEPIGFINALRVPVSPSFVHGSLSPDGNWLALPLIDGATANIWAIPTAGGPMRQLTDFDGRPTLIARQVSWSPDGQFIHAAVAEVGTDVVMYEGLL
jgi:eukaryotic-like serine/threonine-protein kinase